MARKVYESARRSNEMKGGGMKVISKGQYTCSNCSTRVEPSENDIRSWWSLRYYVCPNCNRNVTISGSWLDRKMSPAGCGGKRAKEFGR